MRVSHPSEEQSMLNQNQSSGITLHLTLETIREDEVMFGSTRSARDFLVIPESDVEILTGDSDCNSDCDSDAAISGDDFYLQASDVLPIALEVLEASSVSEGSEEVEEEEIDDDEILDEKSQHQTEKSLELEIPEGIDCYNNNKEVNRKVERDLIDYASKNCFLRPVFGPERISCVTYGRFCAIVVFSLASKYSFDYGKSYFNDH